MIIPRPSYLKKIIELKDNQRVKVITGIRRCGKSYLLNTLYRNYLLENDVRPEQILSISLDNIVNTAYRDPFRLYDFFKVQMTDNQSKYYIFIDEIQFCKEVPNPDVKEDRVSFIHAVIGLMQLPNTDVYVTGSNSIMLSTDILTEFNDRGDEIHVYPLSFSEFYEASTDKLHAWRDYITFGGMPYLFYLDSPEKKSQYLVNLFNETYLKDIIERWNLKDRKSILDTLLKFISSSIGSLTNPTKLSNRFLSTTDEKIKNDTISRYLDYFKDSFLIASAYRYDIKGSKYFTTPLKYYFTDIGLRNACINFRQIEETHLMENIIYNELIRRGYSVDVGIVEKRTSEKSVQYEVDFVINNMNARCYIQSAYSLEGEGKLEQELTPLKNIKDSFRKIVIVYDDIIPLYDENGIYFMGIKDFLLDEKLLAF